MKKREGRLEEKRNIFERKERRAEIYVDTSMENGARNWDYNSCI